MNQNWCYIFPKHLLLRAYSLKLSLSTIKINYGGEMKMGLCVLSNDSGKVDSNFFCYEATVLSPHGNVLIFTHRMRKPT